jgi:hypothetical protein
MNPMNSARLPPAPATILHREERTAGGYGTLTPPPVDASLQAGGTEVYGPGHRSREGAVRLQDGLRWLLAGNRAGPSCEILAASPAIAPESLVWHRRYGCGPKKSKAVNARLKV